MYLLVWGLIAFACASYGQSAAFKIHACVKTAPGNTERLRMAIEKSLPSKAAPPIEFVPEGRPCDHTGAMLRDLSVLLDKRLFKGLRNHHFVYIRNNGNALNVEQFEFANEATALRASKQLSQRTRGLDVMTESGSTHYEFVHTGRTILFLVAPYRGWTDDTRAIVESIRREYSSAK